MNVNMLHVNSLLCNVVIVLSVYVMYVVLKIGPRSLFEFFQELLG